MIHPSLTHSWIELSATALEHNLAFYRTIIGPHKTLGIVVKSNAYGHGMVEISKLLEHNPNANWLLVAHMLEGIQLRQAVITKPILLLNPARTDLDALAHYDLQTMVTDHDILEKLNDVGHAHNKKINIHLKVDTGLSRFGFAPDEIIPLIHTIKKYPFIHINGIYTHFSESNNSDLTFTHEQAERFNILLDALEKEQIEIPYYHTCNSAGITSLQDHPKINLARLGAGAYGLWPSEQTRTIHWQPELYMHLKPVLTWKTNIVHIKTIPAGTPVGYNRTYRTTKETRVAVLPVGYYDGYDKRLSNKGVVHIKGQSAAIIGTIGMNATMIDITVIPQAHLDDEVILLGNHSLITPADLANQTGCFNPRQITVQINPALSRMITK